MANPTGTGDGPDVKPADSTEQREVAVQDHAQKIVELLNSLPGEAREGLRDEVIAAIRDEVDRDPVGSEQARQEGRTEASSAPSGFPPVAFGLLLGMTGVFMWFLVESVGRVLVVVGALFVGFGLLGSFFGAKRGKR